MTQEHSPRKRTFDLRFSILVVSQAVIALLVLIAIFVLRDPARNQKVEIARVVATELQAAGMGSEAIAYYESYLAQGEFRNRGLRSKIAFAIAELYEQEGRLEKALSWYYQVKAWDAKSAQAPEATKKIVALLESLGKVSAAKIALKDGTALEPEKAPEGAVVLATLGVKNLYLTDLNDAIDRLPPELRKNYLSPQGKQEFLRKLVADELLLEKAKRLNIANQPGIKKELALIEKQVLVAKILEDEIYNRISIDEQDLRNFFKANESRYLPKGQKKADFEKVRSAVELDYKMQKGQSLYQQLVQKTLQGDNIKLFPERVK